jgi:L-alanine-DL-glutamate epimerase-like enolase superfamily enzyme
MDWEDATFEWAGVGGRQLPYGSRHSHLDLDATCGESKTPGNTLIKEACWRRGPVTMSAISAVDTALWDIKAKTLDVRTCLLIANSTAPCIAGDKKTPGRG